MKFLQLIFIFALILISSNIEAARILNRLKGNSINGQVKWFNENKGFGFITPSNGSADVFVHLSAIKSDDFRTLHEGQNVKFEIQNGPKGPTAQNVQLV